MGEGIELGKLKRALEKTVPDRNVLQVWGGLATTACLEQIPLANCMSAHGNSERERG